ncbi:MAG: hypothetical protein L3J17_10580 [Candidatus Jettenia sp.]|nr:MAG: hypothetical protein L3J17_10580 [Candidatus Jettenia sp.]
MRASVEKQDVAIVQTQDVASLLNPMRCHDYSKKQEKIPKPRRGGIGETGVEMSSL